MRKHWIFGDVYGRGLATRDDRIATGKNSGYQAIGLAHLFGAARVILLGYDFQRTGGKSHWHGDHPSDLGQGGNFGVWATEMAKLAEHAVERGLEIVNCSRATALRCFPLQKLEAVLGA